VFDRRPSATLPDVIEVTVAAAHLAGAIFSALQPTGPQARRITRPEARRIRRQARRLVEALDALLDGEADPPEVSGPMSLDRLT
jgi:hypothetical protein